MKRTFRLFLLLLIGLFAFGCGADGASQETVESAGLWNLGNRYPSVYSTLRHAYTYEKDGQTIYLTVAKNRKETHTASQVLSDKTQNERTYTLRKNVKRDDDTQKDCTYYECLTDTFRYFVGKDEPDFHAEELLSMDEAITLIENPAAQIDGLTEINHEWSAYYRLEACNLEISVFPADGGRHYRACESAYEQRTEGEETYLYLDADGSICYTNGTDTVTIRQSDRAGKEHTSYNTLSECKAILALLGSK